MLLANGLTDAIECPNKLQVLVDTIDSISGSSPVFQDEAAGEALHQTAILLDMHNFLM